MNLHSRLVRLGTASILTQSGGPFINTNRLDLAKYACRPDLARVLCDYLLYYEHNVKKAMELCHHALKQTGMSTSCSLLVYRSELVLFSGSTLSAQI